MSTLFQVDMLTGQAVAPGTGLTPTPADNIAPQLGGLKESMKAWIDSLVFNADRHAMLVNFCIVILIIVFAKNLFLYLQGFYMAYVQQ